MTSGAEAFAVDLSAPQTQAAGGDRPTKLYRHWDFEGRLLYVGITFSILKRQREHSSHAHWFDAIHNITVETFPSRQAAEQAERKAIIAEEPLHNVIYRNIAEPAIESSADIDVASLRKRLGLTPAAFAGKFGLHLRTLQGWESGDRKLDYTHKNLLRAVARNPEMAAVFLRSAPPFDVGPLDDVEPPLKRRRGRPPKSSYQATNAANNATSKIMSAIEATAPASAAADATS